MLGQIKGTGLARQQSQFPAVVGSCLDRAEDGDMEVMEDLVAFGDGGAFTDRVIAPLFAVISYEVGWPWNHGSGYVVLVMSSG